MTTLLVAGLVLLVVGMARTANEFDRGFGEARIALPDGARVVETAATDDRLFLRLEEAGGARSILVFDLQRKALLGRIRLEEGP